MRTLPYTREAYQLLHEGCKALAKVEAAGFRIDLDHLDNAIRRIKKRIIRREAHLKDSEVMVEWKKAYRTTFNLHSPTQLGKVLFEIMELAEPIRSEETGNIKTDEKALSTVDHPFVQDLLKIRKDRTTLNTFLKGLRREVVDGFVHPSFNLHTTKTYRSSCNDPNGQNFPIRDLLQGRLVRSSIIPRRDCRLVELDLKGLEVSIATCYHHDPTMITYLNDKTKDLHRDMAAECYKLATLEVTKTIRYCGKNMFVFPQFYGDWYLDCAQSLWDAITKMDLRTVSGVPLKDHLKEQGIKECGSLNPNKKPKPGSFVHHLAKVEKRFWNDRFPVYNQWKKDWVKSYKKLAYMKTLTGFVCQGFMKRNEIINYPVQGSAFHCLLQSLIWLVQVELRKKKMKTVIVLQIHDSVLADVPINEYDDFLAIANHAMTTMIRKAWSWVCVPLSIEAEACEIGGSWADKVEVALPEPIETNFRKLIPGTPKWKAHWKMHTKDPSYQENMIRFQKRWYARTPEEEKKRLWR